MADPTPAAGASPPPLNKFPFTVPGTGMLTFMSISFLTQLWAAVLGAGGLGPTIALLQEEVAILMGQVATLASQVAVIFGMHGDGTLSGSGVLTVTETNGVPFGPLATSTDAANLTGTLSPARIANNTIPYAKLVDIAGAALLGAGTTGPVVQVTVGRGVALSAGNVLTAADPITTVGALGATTQRFRAFVTDSSVVAAGNFGNVVAAGGANFCPVYADGAAWRIG